jgi:preprotein translocase subunit SecG
LLLQASLICATTLVVVSTLVVIVCVIIALMHAHQPTALSTWTDGGGADDLFSMVGYSCSHHVATLKRILHAKIN